ncbi:MAG: hypothetical protein MJ246_01075 [Clostridia bacterium]|nr:hypothetical protein [Clostridia bacterium]
MFKQLVFEMMHYWTVGTWLLFIVIIAIMVLTIYAAIFVRAGEGNKYYIRNLKKEKEEKKKIKEK